MRWAPCKDRRPNKTIRHEARRLTRLMLSMPEAMLCRESGHVYGQDVADLRPTSWGGQAKLLALEEGLGCSGILRFLRLCVALEAYG